MKFTETLWLCRAADEARSCEANKFKHVDRLECTPLSGMVYCWQEWANLMRAARGRFSISPAHHCGVPYQKRPSQVLNQPKLARRWRGGTTLLQQRAPRSCTVFVMTPPMNTPVREGETIEGSRTMRNRPYPVLKCSSCTGSNLKKLPISSRRGDNSDIITRPLQWCPRRPP